MKWLIRKYANRKLQKQNYELTKLVQEIYHWTYFKHTPWAIRAKEVLENVCHNRVK